MFRFAPYTSDIWLFLKGNLLLLTCFLYLFAGTGMIIAQPVKRIYLGNDDHTYFMWTANEAAYDSAFVHMLDYYLDQIDATLSNPEDFQA